MTADSTRCTHGGDCEIPGHPNELHGPSPARPGRTRRQEGGPVTGAGNRRKGHTTEAAVAAYLREHGWPHAERRGGGFGGSDIVGTPGITWEVKNQAGLRLGEWVDQMTGAQDDASDRHGVLIVKRKGTTDPGEWFAVMQLDGLLDLLAEAGWTAPA